MKQYKAILFDLDATLLPMDNDEFVKGYFQLLAKKLMPFGISKEKLIPAILDSIKAMVMNDGSRTNAQAFWQRFESMTGFSQAVIGDACIDFYSHEFDQAKVFTRENPLAAQAVYLAHQKADRVALATNPLFPMPGQITRMHWVGLTPADFDLVTSYESDCFCKPNPAYFISVCKRLGVSPADCLMIGNDEGEDMHAGTLAGLDCYLVTDDLIANEKHPWQGPRGTFADMLEMLKAL